MSKRMAQSAAQTLGRKIGQAAPAAGYDLFDQIDGRHPFQNSVPEGSVPYQVRKLGRGQVFYFNFSLAREMGLISATHPDKLTPALTQKIIDTFSIQIINEYDLKSGFAPAPETIKPHPHMATRYLQLQHANKRGTTSGDGRSIWNGAIRHNGITWDISSRGTGVTSLAPGSVQAGEPLKTGATDFGYGCGLADVSELVGSALMSEIFHSNGLETERVLAIIDLGKGCGIGVRAAPNLIRPAHLFLYLKQGRHAQLRQAADYLIRRETQNRRWKISTTSPDRYRLMLKELTIRFARFAAYLERNYIFAWLEWDGDNVLASAGIIDYGSIRQFGLRHDQYRYDDVERFSTNLNEQRGKARLTVQVFIQLAEYAETGRRRPLESFANHTAVREFDREFDREARRIFLTQIGFSEKQAIDLMKSRSGDVERVYSRFLALEKTKTKAGQKKLPDGVNRPAVFNMRAALRELPEYLSKSEAKSEAKHQIKSQAKSPDSWTPDFISNEDLLDLISTQFAKRADRKLKGSLKERLDQFKRAYITLLKNACEGSRATFLRTLATNAQETNRAGRVTGNGAEYVVEAILKARKRGLPLSEIQAAIDLFVTTQSPKIRWQQKETKAVSMQSPTGQLLHEMLNICQDFEEDI